MSGASDTTFIETQLPVSKLSKESYKERKAVSGQTLTGLGKWWGRKPLIMIRAAILGLLLPASNDPRRDREVFLKVLTMDDEGLWQRKSKAIALKDLFERLTPAERLRWFDEATAKPKYRRGLKAGEKARIQRLVFERMSYDEKLTYCDRPEQIDGPSGAAWVEINAHLGTDAASLPALVRQLGEHRFGHKPRVGDAFCGGGSVPFEAARIGCDAYGSDLNPVAALLTWGALNIVGGGEEVADQVHDAQQRVFDAVDRQITGWDEIVPQVEIEVEEQLKSMLALDDKDDPNFSDADYQLAAYAAALRVLTQYRGIEDIDVAYELSRERKRGEASPIEGIIEDAVKTASNFLVPDGIDPQLWRRLSPEQKLYLKCLEVESHGDYRSGVFQESARGFGVRDYRYMLQSGKANQTRLKTATEFKRREWGTEGFGASLLRHALFAVYQTAERDDAKIGLTYLKTEIPDYWAQRENLAGMLRFIGTLPIPHWAADAEAARLLAGAVENDHV